MLSGVWCARVGDVVVGGLGADGGGELEGFWVGFGVDVGELCAEEGEGVFGGVGPVELGLDAHDVAVDAFFEGFEVAGRFQEVQGAFGGRGGW